MSHFAEIDSNNIVLRVIVGPVGMSDAEGLQWCLDALGGVWVQTSYNAKMRKNYAGIGYTFNPTLDAFIAPQPFSSWSLDENCHWHAPTPMPTDGKRYQWDEATLIWVVQP